MTFDKSKVYTALNADELKVNDKVILADNITHLKAQVSREEGIVTLDFIDSEDAMSRFSHFYTKDDAECVCTGTFAYLIEHVGEKKWRPYKDCDEMIADFKKRFNVDCPDCEIPSIWVQCKIRKFKRLITKFCEPVVNMTDEVTTLLGLFNRYTYLDGSLCGMEE